MSERKCATCRYWGGEDLCKSCDDDLSNYSQRTDWSAFSPFKEVIEPEKKGADSVQVSGDHYKRLGVQPWAAMQAWMTHEQFVGFLRGNIVKYAARTGSKGEALEDVRKLAHYAQKLIEVLEAQ